MTTSFLAMTATDLRARNCARRRTHNSAAPTFLVPRRTAAIRQHRVAGRWLAVRLLFERGVCWAESVVGGDRPMRICPPAHRGRKAHAKPSQIMSKISDTNPSWNQTIRHKIYVSIFGRYISLKHPEEDSPWYLRDRCGWPIEIIKDRPLESVLRILCANIRKMT